ncbi:MAG: peroxiredoxin [Alphaproteobacteria bacterium]|nr:peroxiredoxin [Alphaproteobacteria bacterium]
MTIKVGDKIPSVTLRYMGPSGPATITTDDLTKGKKVVLFNVPGAFTPTCSAKHLPGFVQNADKIKAKGIDTVACVSVNDAFVMDAWGKAQNTGDKVMMLADGNGDLARAMGVEMDGTGFGLGHRARRYSMVIDNGKVTKFNLEEAGKFEISSAEKMLEQI